MSIVAMLPLKVLVPEHIKSEVTHETVARTIYFTFPISGSSYAFAPFCSIAQETTGLLDNNV